MAHRFLDRTIQKNGAKPKYIITDKGKQFWCDGFKGWCFAFVVIRNILGTVSLRSAHFA